MGDCVLKRKLCSENNAHSIQLGILVKGFVLIERSSHCDSTNSGMKNASFTKHLSIKCVPLLSEHLLVTSSEIQTDLR